MSRICTASTGAQARKASCNPAAGNRQGDGVAKRRLPAVGNSEHPGEQRPPQVVRDRCEEGVALPDGTLVGALRPDHQIDLARRGDPGEGDQPTQVPVEERPVVPLLLASGILGLAALARRV